jgi:uncharacterized RDD family membrane protein YckC
MSRPLAERADLGYVGLVRHLIEEYNVEASSSPQSPAQPVAPGPQSPTGAFVEVPAAAMAPTATPLASVGKRFGGMLLEGALFVCTLGIGWLIWAIIVMSRGQTPAKQLLHMRVVNVEDGRAATWGKMFVRDVLCKWVIGLVAGVTFIGIILYFWLCWDDKNQELWDKMVNTVVVDDPEDQLDPRNLVAA